ncbi:hypothetical protein KIN20_020481 [Parelaphostrongylus tenuis]|uniref:Uncharacterized protein n=1 Tax=Parelaphostrongylus tenuis TaxID=148309 RepID=A0AAD5N392_PARTN|nr:hypothetical protein KIN20_020481 [Parelaphostrongylus tenuis]
MPIRNVSELNKNFIRLLSKLHHKNFFVDLSSYPWKRGSTKEYDITEDLHRLTTMDDEVTRLGRDWTYALMEDSNPTLVSHMTPSYSRRALAKQRRCSRNFDEAGMKIGLRTSRMTAQFLKKPMVQ